MRCVILVIIFAFMIVPSYAEEFYSEYFDGNKYLLNYQITNGTVIDVKGIPYSVFFHVNSSKGELTLTIPKTAPISYDYDGEFGLYVFENGREIEYYTHENVCDFTLTIDIEGESEIEFAYPSLLVANEITYFEVHDMCFDNPEYRTEIQQMIKAKECPNSFEKGLNLRDNVVCVFPESYSELRARGYLKTFPIVQ